MSRQNEWADNSPRGQIEKIIDPIISGGATDFAIDNAVDGIMVKVFTKQEIDILVLCMQIKDGEMNLNDDEEALLERLYRMQQQS